MTEKVLTERKGKVATVTINRPEVHNCVDNEIASGMNAVFDELERDAGDGLRSSRSQRCRRHAFKDSAMDGDEPLENK